jgi:hypothetical protein
MAALKTLQNPGAPFPDLWDRQGLAGRLRSPSFGTPLLLSYNYYRKWRVSFYGVGMTERAREKRSDYHTGTRPGPNCGVFFGGGNIVPCVEAHYSRKRSYHKEQGMRAGYTDMKLESLQQKGKQARRRGRERGAACMPCSPPDHPSSPFPPDLSQGKRRGRGSTPALRHVDGGTFPA